MPKSGAYEISLLVNEQPLHEYDPPNDDNHTNSGEVIKYIEAIEGSTFRIKCTVAPRTLFPTSLKSVDVQVDGKFVNGFLIVEQRSGSSERGWTGIRRDQCFKEGGSYVQRPLIFKALTTTEETMSLEDIKKLAKNIGCIHIKIYDVAYIATHSLKEAPQFDQSVPEKALKGRPIDMTAGYGPVTATERRETCHVHRIGKPLANFVLKYRSRRALQLFDLLSTAPEPEPLEERNIDTLNPEEMRQLLTQIREQGSQLSGKHTEIKRAMTLVKEEDDPSMRSSKRQRSTLGDADEDDCVIVEVKKRRVAPEEVDVLDLI